MMLSLQMPAVLRDRCMRLEEGPVSPPSSRSTLPSIDLLLELEPSVFDLKLADQSEHKPKRQKVSKNVSFSGFDDVFCYDPPTPEDIEASWLQEEDKTRIRLDCKLCAWAYMKVLANKTTNMPQGCCMRGLEKTVTRKHRRMAFYRRKEVSDAVLSAQGWKCSEDLLRLVSLSRSREMVKEAIKVAERDSQVWVEEFNRFR
jgi:hypothetical protein